MPGLVTSVVLRQTLLQTLHAASVQKVMTGCYTSGKSGLDLPQWHLSLERERPNAHVIHTKGEAPKGPRPEPLIRLLTLAVAATIPLVISPAVDASLFLRFRPTEGQPGTEVVGRTAGRGAFTGQEGKAFGLYLQHGDGKGLEDGSILVDRLVVTKKGDGVTRFVIPNVPSGRYSLVLDCPPCRPFSAGRRFLEVGNLRVLAGPTSTVSEAPRVPDEPSQRAEPENGAPWNTLIGVLGIILSHDRERPTSDEAREHLGECCRRIWSRDSGDKGPLRPNQGIA